MNSRNGGRGVKGLMVALGAGVLLTSVGASSAFAAPAGDKATWPAKVRAFERAWETGTWRSNVTAWFSGFPTQQSYFDPTVTPPNPVPLNPERKAMYDEMRRNFNLTGEVPFDPDGLCHPRGLPYVLAGGDYQLEMSDDKILMLYPDLEYRVVYMDGRKVPADRDVTFYGHSTGRWEGDTLVIETVNLRGRDTQIEPHIEKSDKSTLVERWTPVSDTEINAQFTLTDPEYLTRPWTVNYKLNRDPNGRFDESLCTDGNRYTTGANGDLVMSTPDGAPLTERADPVTE